MNERLIPIYVSEDTYQRLERESHVSERPIEAVVTEALEQVRLPNERHAMRDEDVESQLATMEQFSDEQLWDVVRTQPTPEQSRRMHELSEQVDERDLSTSEKLESDDLTDLVMQQMLLRSEALVQLKQRGYDVSAFFRSKI